MDKENMVRHYRKGTVKLKLIELAIIRQGNNGIIHMNGKQWESMQSITRGNMFNLFETETTELSSSFTPFLPKYGGKHMDGNEKQDLGQNECFDQNRTGVLYLYQESYP